MSSCGSPDLMQAAGILVTVQDVNGRAHKMEPEGSGDLEDSSLTDDARGVEEAKSSSADSKSPDGPTDSSTN